MTTRVLAPGKLFLVGEYAVLEGFPAVVMAVDRYARVRRSPISSRSAPLIASARSAAARALGIEPDGNGYEADSAAFFDGRKKLGLGSSAAVTVASVASVFFKAGRDVEAAATRREMWGVAKAVHDGFQKAKGSGADLAASLFGGFVVFDPTGPDRPAITRWDFPAETSLVFVWTGRSASTSDALDAVGGLKEKEPTAYRRIVEEMGAVARRLVSRNAAPTAGVIGSFREYAQLMDDLGRRAGVPIVTTAIEKVIHMARELGGAAKPSGAGGGDFVVAAFADADAAHRFRAAVVDAGFRVFELHPAVRGVHVVDVSADEEARDG
ncbi:MAG: hypothetical protein HY897_08710 [Deltaproteobacteria bacterium]|nr:hypothetical protein [Deltaproteobacteria bacterium]